MTKKLDATQLSSAEKKYLEKIRGLYFGRIENLVIEKGQPLFGKDTCLYEHTKFGSKNSIDPKSSIQIYALNPKVIEMFECFRASRDQTIKEIQIKHGLPFSMESSPAGVLCQA